MTTTTPKNYDATVCQACATYMHTGDPRALSVHGEFIGELDERIDAMAPFRAVDWSTLAARPGGGFDNGCAVCGMSDHVFTVTVRNAVPHERASLGGMVEIAYPGPGDMAVRFDSRDVEPNATALFGWVSVGEYRDYTERLRDLSNRKLRKALDKIVAAGYGAFVEQSAEPVYAVEYTRARGGRHYLTCDGLKLRVTGDDVQVNTGSRWTAVVDEHLRAAVLAAVPAPVAA